MRIKMKLFKQLIIASALLCSVAISQETIKVPLSSPGESGLLKVSLIEGSISVVGHDGDGIEVTVDENAAQTKTYKGRKMKKLTGARGGFSIVEDKNTVSISVEPWTDLEEIEIKVPHSFALELHAINEGDITVSDVFGELDINNINGKVTLKNVIGPVVAHALNEDVTVDFKEIPEDEDMSITSLNGDLELTLPDDSEFDIDLKTDNGDILSDFEIDITVTASGTSEKTDSKKGKYKLSGDNKITGKVNGGGGEIKMHTMNGDVILISK